MVFSDHLAELYGLPAFTFPEDGAAADLPAPDAVAWRVRAGSADEDGDWEQVFERLCSAVDTTRIKALIVGAWECVFDCGPDDVIEALLAARDRLPALRALFLGDIVFEESELSWITQTDVTGLLRGFPALEEFGVRGGTNLEFPALRHDSLRSLTVQTGGLPAGVVRGIGASDLPALEHLDVWLGDSSYGADSEPADLEGILSGARLPRLRHLALRNSEIQDEVAAAVAAAPVVARLEVLDLSMGVLTDEGAAALLGGQPLTHLKKLDLHHHYIGEAFRQRIRQTLEPAGVEVDLDPGEADQDQDDDGTVFRYVAAGE